ncbi:MAG: hypothetical protein VX936_13685, partial [Planctomycetota bacterium]|nr:hypothetical protein [Planctomycetota bacterium]
DADPLVDHPDALKIARGWSKSRVPDDAVEEHRQISRLYSVESQFTVTGANADHRWPVKSSHIAAFASSLKEKVVAANKAGKPVEVSGSAAEKRMAILANELMFGISGTGNSHGRCVVLAGASQPAAVHQLVAFINEAIGSTLVEYTEIEESSSSLQSIGQAVEAIRAGAKALLIIGGNPVYDAPADLGFESAIEGVAHKVHFSMSRNETTDRCDWHLNQAHPMEVWSDSVAYDGSHCLGQPMIAPLFDAKSTAELLSLLLGGTGEGSELVRSAFASLDDSAWSQLVHDGFVSGSAAKPVKLQGAKEPAKPSMAWGAEDDRIEVVFRTGNLYDGRLANNGWMQEVPDSVTKVTWDNPAVMNPKTAKAIGAKQNEKVKIEVGGRTIEAPVFIQPGQADNSISIAIGYGRK